MQSDLGKLFIGGISWDTNEERLQEYFSSFGEVLEAVIMKDHTTGRARGFGFVVFSDPAVAERVIKEKHNIDGRMVNSFVFQSWSSCFSFQTMHNNHFHIIIYFRLKQRRQFLEMTNSQ